MAIISQDQAPQELLDDYLQLTDSALRRVREPEQGLYIAESLTILDRALSSGHRPRSVLTGTKWAASAQQLLTSHHHPDTPIIVADEDFLFSLTGFHLHRGTLASMNRPVLPGVTELLLNARRIVVLEDIVDHTNVGALFRSVAAMGANAVVVSERCADPLYRRSVRVSMGTVLQVPWTRATSLKELFATLHLDGWVVVGMALTESAVDFDQWVTRAPEKVALVFGSEGPGLSAQTVRACDVVAKIAMSHGVDSLNVAASGAVALHALRVAQG